MSDKLQAIFDNISALADVHTPDAIAQIKRLAIMGKESASQPPAVKGAALSKNDLCKVFAWAEKFYGENGDQLMLDDNVWYITRDGDEDGVKNCKEIYPEELVELYLLHHPDEGDESPTAAGEGKARETIEDILLEKCSEIADAILRDIKGAGDGKEDAVAFQEWIQEEWYTYNGVMRKWIKNRMDGWDLVCDTTAELYDIFKNRNNGK